MKALEPKHVIKAINKLLEKRGYKMKYLEPSNEMDEASLKASLWHKEQEILKRAAGTSMEFFENEAIQLPLDESSYQDPAQMKRVTAILDQAGTGKNILSIADGGYIGNLLRMRGNKVTVTDISEIRNLRCKYLLKLESYQCRAEKLPFKDQSFDVVILAEMLEHVPNMSVPLAEAERVLKKDGKLIITIPVGRKHDAYTHHIKKIEMNNIDDDTVVLGISNIKDHYEKYAEFNKEFYK
jgi:ubiquinone/menaquinone biosynthesis C-methylase UbiE